MTCDCRAFVPASLLSHGISSRPLFSWMPTRGPVAYQVQSLCFVSRVISTVSLYVALSSVLLDTQTVREPLLVPSTIAASLSCPRLCVSSNQIVPVSRSTTGHGLPQVLLPSSQTTCILPQVLPPSVLRLRTRSIS